MFWPWQFCGCFLCNSPLSFLCLDDFDWLSRGCHVQYSLIPQNILLYIACEQALRGTGVGVSPTAEREPSRRLAYKKFSLCLSSLLTVFAVVECLCSVYQVRIFTDMQNRVRIKYS